MQPDRDRLYAQPLEQVTDFVFDAKVAEVFPDMINRSVPGYATIVRMIGLLAASHVGEGGRCYDLGCSLGASALAMARGIEAPGCRIVAVDNSPAMLARARTELNKADPSTRLRTGLATPIDLVCADIRDVRIRRASLVVLNFTLQFIPPAGRAALLQEIHDNLLPGGILVLSEKIAFEDAGFQTLFAEMHHQFKKDQGYSDLEVSQKRQALERVLLPETLACHRERLERVGFQRQALWFQCFNFMSLLAVR
ncbi:MAG: carboxy-S-adenosyl-L-methionine synthase CmoA [Gammaproteobacteria bacterium]|nr:carboxy-S-adenosyl-L-methionine synthase CmoA [Gammaproteobacteria bacterium]MBU1655736.1 carboxy-S-adenosyl-L-methionine synthase CmoA [Gammaproteobacteria bacterium]MBU1960108.1 carboxy-S-adenosyl-L-methionine synthase CmoA [Gammaproteobacteria bacterium]